MQEFELDITTRVGETRGAALPSDTLPDLLHFLTGWERSPELELKVMTEGGVVAYRRADVASYELKVSL